jgi:hypothetical protein
MSISSISVALFRPEHLIGFKFRDVEAREIPLMCGSWSRLLELAERSQAGVLFRGNQAQALIGYEETAPGVCHLWAFPSVNAMKRPLTYIRTALRYVTMIEELPWVHRLETLSLDSPIEDEWMRFLGLTCEGAAWQSPGGKTYKLWSKEVNSCPS